MAFSTRSPQLHKITDSTPAVAQIYIAGMEVLEEGVLSEAERNIALLAISEYNNCHYCVRIHAGFAHDAGLHPSDIEAVNQGGLPGSESLRSVVQAARLLMEREDELTTEDYEVLTKAGITPTHLYELSALIALKTMSNYINHVSQTEVDPEVSDLFPIMDEFNKTEWPEAPRSSAFEAV